MSRYMPLVVLVVLGQTLLAYLLVNQLVVHRLMGPPPEELVEVKANAPVSDEPERVYRDLGEFLLNPADTLDEQGLRFVKTTITLGIVPRLDASVSEAYNQLKAQNPRLRDAIIGILTAKEVSEMDSPEDREFIKDEIRFAVNDLLTTGEVLHVYLIEFIIQ